MYSAGRTIIPIKRSSRARTGRNGTLTLTMLPYGLYLNCPGQPCNGGQHYLQMGFSSSLSLSEKPSGSSNCVPQRTSRPCFPLWREIPSKYRTGFSCSSALLTALGYREGGGTIHPDRRGASADPASPHQRRHRNSNLQQYSKLPLIQLITPPRFY